MQDTGCRGLWTSGQEEGGEDTGLRVHLGMGVDGPVAGPAASSWPSSVLTMATTPHTEAPGHHRGHCGHGRSSEVLPGRGGCSVNSAGQGAWGQVQGWPPRPSPEACLPPDRGEEVRLCP